MIRASRKWCKRQKKRDHLGNRKAKQWEKSCHWGKRKQRELPFLYHSSGYETAATKACTQRSGHFSGFSTNISRHLGSNGLHRFSVYIISLWNIIPFTLINPHSDSQPRRLDPEVTGTHYTALWTAVKVVFPDVRGPWQKHQRLLSFTELAWQWRSKSRPLHSLLKELSIFIGSSSGPHSPHVMSLLALHWCLPFDKRLAEVACCSQGFTPKLPL